MRKTKIVCTIGPASEKKEMLTKLVNSGMNIMRINFSHGSHQEHGEKIKLIREVMQDTNKTIGILLDTKGPEIRTCNLENGEDVFLETDQEFIITIDPNFVGNKNKVAVTYEKIVQDLKVGDIVLIDDGLIELEVKEITSEVKCIVKNSGYLGEKKGVNLPGVSVNLPAIAEKDKADLKFGCEQDVDFVAASFIRKAADVLDIRKYLDDNNGFNIKIISKIESQEGIDNFEEILKITDGIMVARGDLGVEIPIEEVPFAQKMMIRRCNEVGKVVITATQMLDSMIRNPRPTRAEAGDVANAVLDGTDAVMLSGESAKGKYAKESVEIMAKLCEKSDNIIQKNKMDFNSEDHTITKSVSMAAVNAAELLNAKAIIVATQSGKSAMNLRKYFPKSQIVAFSNNRKTINQLTLVKGVIPLYLDKVTSTDEFYKISESIVNKIGICKSGDIVVIVAGVPIFDTGATNMMKIEVLR